MDREHPLKRQVSVAAALCGLMLSCGESDSLPAYGEVLVEIDTNLAVPTMISRLRIDVFDAERRWLETRDFAVAARELPLSFSLYSKATAETRVAWVRVRGYAEGRERDYLGERFRERIGFEEVGTSESLSEACLDAPFLEPGFLETLRFRGEPFDDADVSCDSGGALKRTRSGLAVFGLTIPEDGDYRVAVTAAAPGLEWAFVADTLLSLRSTCEDTASELVCNDDEHAEFSPLSGLTAPLESGEYFVVVGNIAPGPMDVTLVLREAGAPDAPPGGLTPPPDADPRLVVDGVDVTPRSEPEPGLAVDRLARVEIEAGAQRTARLLLDGECVGTMADLEGARTCVDRENVLSEVRAEPLLEGRIRSSASAEGSWRGYENVGCGQPSSVSHPELFDERVCVPGGAFVLGDPSVIALGPEAGQPERAAVILPLFVDRYEYSVARYRAARQEGFEPPDAGPYNNPLPLDTRDFYQSCTWNEALDGSSFHPDREALPLSCVSWLTARELCRFDGGDLPSVAEREYAASAAGRQLETTYPWGEAAPACEQALFGRRGDLGQGSAACFDAERAAGPGPVAVGPWAHFDRTPQGVVGLGGNVAEWTRDSHRSYGDDCWQSQGLRSPTCTEREAPLHTIAGGSWRSPAGGTRAALRTGGAAAGLDPWTGFRCVYPAREP